MNAIDRHFCVTVYVKRTEDKKFLMIKHKKLHKWLPPGGHIDDNETPDAAALRETFEETGLHVELVGEKPPVEGGLIRPWGIQVNVIKLYQEEHIDLIYLAFPLPDQTVQKNVSETDGIGWFSKDAILDPQFNTFPSIKTWVSRFFE